MSTDEFDYQKLNEEVDELLSDVRELLAQEELTEAESPEEELPKQEVPQEKAPIRAEDVQIDYEKFYGEIPPEPHMPQNMDETILFKPLTNYEKSKSAYQTVRRAQYEKEREQERIERERSQMQRQWEAERELERQEELRRSARKDPPRPGSKEYAQWLYEQGKGPETCAQRDAEAQRGAKKSKTAPKKKGRGFGRFLLTLLIVLGILVGIAFLAARQPRGSSETLGEHRKDCSVILIAGTDGDGRRTDTMMLMSVDRKARQVSLLSIPRDTLVYGGYSVPKLNSAYGWAGTGEAGMEELMTRVCEITGYVPDGYVALDLQSFEQLVDLMGGVRFDVPMDMYYNDPSQNLYINIPAGEQKLNGEQAMQLVRFRSGYANADLGRVSVQREFVSAALKQWTSVTKLPRLPAALKLLRQSSTGNLTSGNYLWLAESMLLCSLKNTRMETLPGQATYISGGSYYILYPESVAQLLNDCCNPYTKGVTAADLKIRVG